MTDENDESSSECEEENLDVPVIDEKLLPDCSQT